MPQVFKARFFDGRTATHQNVDVHLQRQDVKIEFEDGTSRIWENEKFRVLQDRSQGPLRLEYGAFPPEILEVEDPKFSEGFGNKISGKSPLKLWGLALLTVLLVPATIYWALPLASGLVAKFVPVSIEKQLGQYVINELFAERKICESTAGKPALEKLVSRLTPADSTYEFQVEVIDSTLVNAIAFPGGSILIFRGLLEKSPSAEALSGVLAHEMQHVLQRHGTENLLNQAALFGVFKLLTVEENAIAETLFAGVQVLSLLKYTRALELEADSSALQLLSQAEINPEEMLTMFKVLQNNSSSLPDVLLSHPDMSFRLQKLKELIELEADYESKPVLSAKSWKDLQNICQIVN
ncbi:MAG: M48 family metallopeptidase [SAR324 cluster bacterium]|nr:M48 family metallopeptidase [SAR324 cluster bacterium]